MDEKKFSFYTVRLDAEQSRMLRQIAKASNRKRSEVLRLLISEGAKVFLRPAGGEDKANE